MRKEADPQSLKLLLHELEFLRTSFAFPNHKTSTNIQIHTITINYSRKFQSLKVTDLLIYEFFKPLPLLLRNIQISSFRPA